MVLSRERLPWLLGALVLGAAAPVRAGSDLPLVGSVSLLDGVIVVVGMSLLATTATTLRLDVGYPRLFALLTFPLVVNTVSLAWSQDAVETLRASLSYIEGLIAYLYVVRATRGVAAERIVALLRRFGYLLLVPPALMLARVPGFAPQLPGLSTTSTDYVGYYTRLSHPFIGRSNNLATVLAFVVVILLWWGMTRGDRRSTRAGVVVAAAIVATLSRGVILSLAVVACWYLVVVGPRARLTAIRIGALVAASGATAMLLLFAVAPEASQHLASRLDPANLTDRSQLASTAIAKVAARPLLGYGGAVTPDNEPTLTAGVHNTYLQQILSFGVPLGVAVSLSFVGLAWFFFARAGPGTAGRVLGASLLVQLLIFTNQSSFEGVVLRVIFYLSVGLGAGLLAATEPATPEPSGSPAPLPIPSEDHDEQRPPPSGAPGVLHRR